jgi:hypothetical protein
LLFTCFPFFGLHEFRLFHSNTRVRLQLSSPNTGLVTVKVSVTLFLRSAQNVMHTRCSFLSPIAKLHEARYTTLNKTM